MLRSGRLINPGQGSDRTLRDGFSIEPVPGNKLPGYDRLVPPGQNQHTRVENKFARPTYPKSCEFGVSNAKVGKRSIF
jgi:hypothetical protein